MQNLSSIIWRVGSFQIGTNKATITNSIYQELITNEWYNPQLKKATITMRRSKPMISSISNSYKQ